MWEWEGAFFLDPSLPRCIDPVATVALQHFPIKCKQVHSGADSVQSKVKVGGRFRR